MWDNIFQKDQGNADVTSMKIQKSDSTVISIAADEDEIVMAHYDGSLTILK